MLLVRQVMVGNGEVAKVSESLHSVSMHSLIRVIALNPPVDSSTL